jgi:DNA-binding protein HU-beta
MVDEIGISPVAADMILNAISATIRTGIKQGRVVRFAGLGVFSARARLERSGRNPRTGASIKIKAAKVPKIRLYRKTKDRLMLGQINESQHILDLLALERGDVDI